MGPVPDFHLGACVAEIKYNELKLIATGKATSAHFSRDHSLSAVTCVLAALVGNQDDFRSQCFLCYDSALGLALRLPQQILFPNRFFHSPG